MDIEKIDQAFTEMIHRRSVHKVLDMRPGSVMQLRFRMRRGSTIKLENKIRLLQKAGIRMDHKKWTDKDLQDLVTFCIRTSDQARQFGAAYVIEKWIRS